MIEFDADTHRNIIQVSFSEGNISLIVNIDGEEFENALDTLLDGYFLNDWLKETMKAKVENYFDHTPNMTDEELQRFIEILEDMR